MNADRTVARIELPIAGDGDDPASYDALATLRTEIVPATVGGIQGADTGVTGETAGSKDFTDAVRGKAPLVFAFVLGLAFLLMLVAFRSVVIALKTITLNLLSVAAAFTASSCSCSSTGSGRSCSGSVYTEGVMAWLPVFLFVILFGLSMDYHVFILSRIREAYDRGMRTEDAIAHGIKSSAGVVTSAAIVMVFVFSIFATASQRSRTRRPSRSRRS